MPLSDFKDAISEMPNVSDVFNQALTEETLITESLAKDPSVLTRLPLHKLADDVNAARDPWNLGTYGAQLKADLAGTPEAERTAKEADLLGKIDEILAYHAELKTELEGFVVDLTARLMKVIEALEAEAVQKQQGAENFMDNLLTPTQAEYLRRNDPPKTYGDALEDDSWADIVWKWSKIELSHENFEYGRAIQAMKELAGGSKEQWEAARAIYRNYVANQKANLSSHDRDELVRIMGPHVDDDNFRLSLDPDDQTGVTPDMFDESHFTLSKMMTSTYSKFVEAVGIIHQIWAE
jgi:hypothetical protein